MDRHGMMCCPFHEDKHPSMKVDVRYYCFGCHETGDVINFAAKVFNLTPYEAAKKLARDFGIDPHTPDPVTVPKEQSIWQQRKDEGYCASVLINYECLLKQWRLKYAPSIPGAPWNERFVTACNTLPSISGLLDCLYSPDAELRKNTAEALVRTGTISRLEGILKNNGEDGMDVCDDVSIAA